jgi:hypothetical protein
VLAYPFPPQVKINRLDRQRQTVTLTMTLPADVADDFSHALEIAGRHTGNDRLGMQMAMICAEFLSTWAPRTP